MDRPARETSAGLSPTVKALGLVSLFTDVSSEMVYPINPIFLTTALGAPAWTVGVVEGIAESTASLLKLWSGWLSDRLGARKPLAVAGYGVAAVAKPLMGVATVWGHVLGARFLDRFGKGVRTAPRDALIAENCAPEIRGRAFGFHRSLDTIGAVTGPLIGYLVLSRIAPSALRTHPGDLRRLYFLAFLPAVLGVLILALSVRDRPKPPTPNAPRPALPTWSSLTPVYRRYLLIVGLFSLGNSSDAFLLLRAQDMGVGVEELLLLYAVFNVVEAALAYPAGRLSDTVGRQPLIAAGYAVFALVYLGFGLLGAPAAAWTLFVVYGLYYTLTQGTQRAFAADLAHPERRATEIGAFHMLVGLAALPASLAAGQLYSRVSHAAPFLLGAGCAAAAALLLLLTVRRGPASI